MQKQSAKPVVNVALLNVNVQMLTILTYRRRDFIQNFIGQEESDDYGDSDEEVEPPTDIPE